MRKFALNKGWDDTKFRILMTIHDEIVVECSEEIEKEAAVLIENSMVSAAQHYVKQVPMKVDVQVGTCWLH